MSYYDEPIDLPEISYWLFSALVTLLAMLVSWPFVEWLK